MMRDARRTLTAQEREARAWQRKERARAQRMQVRRTVPAA
jgi:hypothetical protein